jgi:hypothetical protein
VFTQFIQLYFDMKNSLFILFWAICSTFQAVGQTGCYVQLQDGSGINNAAMQVKLDSAAIRIRQILPTASQAGFHIYQAGFYIQQENYKKWQYPELFDTIVKRVALTSSAHILIGWQNDTRGLNTQFSVDVYLPNFGSCSVDVSDLAKVFLETHLEKAYNQNSRAPGLAYAAVVRCLDDLAIYLQDIKTCCQQGGNDVASCVTCVRPDNQKNFLYAQGFTAIPIKNIGIDPQPFVRPEIINRANLLFTIDDLTAVDLGAKYNMVIDTFLADTLSICVIITKDENLCTPVWDSLTTIATSGQFDMVYWHHIHKGNGIGDAFLFTNAYFDGKGNQRFDGHEKDRFVTNIVAALGSAATDFLFQVAAHYFFDEDIPRGTEGFKWAVGRVDYWEVTKSGVFGLFGVNSKVETVVRALASATAETINTAKYHFDRGDNYTYDWAAKDFGTVFLEDLVSGALEEVLGKAAGKALGKIKKIPFPGWCKVASMLNKNLGTMIPGCFVGGTLVWTKEGRIPIEKIAVGDWAFADIGLNPHKFVKIAPQNTLFSKSDNQILSDVEPQTNNKLDILYSPNYDFEEITPINWSAASFNVQKTDGTVGEVTLLRPNLWFEEQEIRIIGDTFWLDYPEMRMSGFAKLINIYATQIDTRSSDARILLEKGYFPVLSTFKHKAEEVLNLSFTNGDRIFTTAPHPFWSLDRNGWIAASHLMQGERVKAVDGEQTVDSIFFDKKLSDVFNLEVQSAHNYVINGGIFVHNACSFVGDLDIFIKSYGVKLQRITERFTDGLSDAYAFYGKKIINGVERKVYYTKFGFPDFANFCPGKSFCFHVSDLNGKGTDFSRATTWLINQKGASVVRESGATAIEIFENGVWNKYTWHHHEDCKTLMPVLSEVHNKFSHTGGAAMIEKAKAELIGMFASPFNF